MGILLCCKRDGEGPRADFDLFSSQISSVRERPGNFEVITPFSPIKTYYEANIPRMSSDVQVLFKAHFTKSILRRVDYILKPLSVEEMQHLAVVLDQLADVESVTLVGNHLGAAGLEVILPSLQKLPKLFKLKIAQNDLQDAGTLVLSRGLGKMAYLQELLLEENCITDKGAFLLSKVLPDCHELTLLDLQRNLIGLSGYEELLKAASECERLETIKISGNSFPLPTSRSSLPFKVI